MTEKKRRRPRGMRKDGRIQVTYTDGRRPDGKPNRISFYGSTRAEAEEKRSVYIDEKKQGLSYADRTMTANEWIDKWVSMYDVDERAYGTYIRRMKNDFGSLMMRNINEATLTKSLAAFNGKSRSGAAKYRMILKQVFHRAHKNHIITDDPAEDLNLPDDVTAGTHRALARWEIELIMNNWTIHPAGRWAMLELFCGLRRGEMIALDWSAIDMENRVLTVRAAASFSSGKKVINNFTKTPAGMRKLPICEPLFQMLDATPVEKRVGAVCLSSNGKPISQNAADKNWDAYCKAMSGLLHGSVFSCRQHDLRHTFATMLFESGIAPKDAQYYLGHANIQITADLYTHLTEERKKVSNAMVTGYLDSWIQRK